jgi:hypothetical protein
LKENEKPIYNSCWVSNGIDRAPDNVQPRTDLPEVSNHDGGVLIPIETANYLSYKLRCLWRYPEVCNTVIDANKQIYDNRVKDLTEQIERLKKIEPDKPDRWWLWTALGVVGGASIGLVAGVLAAK